MHLFGMRLSDLLISIPAVLICITFHEFAHGWAADRMGDQTARLSGRLSLNPVSHIDPIGFICLVLFRFGWAKPVPVNPRNFKKPSRDMAITAAAGPAANMILAFILVLAAWGLSYIRSEFVSALVTFLITTAILSVGLGLFNLLPLPPLDGSKIIMPLLPIRARQFCYQYQKYFQLALLLFLYTGILSGPLGIARSFIYRGIVRIVGGIYGIFGL